MFSNVNRAQSIFLCVLHVHSKHYLFIYSLHNFLIYKSFNLRDLIISVLGLGFTNPMCI